MLRGKIPRVGVFEKHRCAGSFFGAYEENGMMHAEYLSEPLDRPRKCLDDAVRILTYETKKFDAIVCCGVSGLLLAPMVALYMDKRLGVVRKKVDKDHHNHSEFRVETAMQEGDRWIFIDDIIASGATLHYVRDSMVAMGFDQEAGTYLYSDSQGGAPFRDTRSEFSFWDKKTSEFVS